MIKQLIYCPNEVKTYSNTLSNISGLCWELMWWTTSVVTFVNLSKNEWKSPWEQKWLKFAGQTLFAWYFILYKMIFMHLKLLGKLIMVKQNKTTQNKTFI